jgi:hypothetical protein
MTGSNHPEGHSVDLLQDMGKDAAQPVAGKPLWSMKDMRQYVEQTQHNVV